MRRHFQFSVRALLVVMVVAALIAAGAAKRMRRLALEARIAEAREELRYCQDLLAMHRAMVSARHVTASSTDDVKAAEVSVEIAEAQVKVVEARLRTLEGR